MATYMYNPWNQIIVHLLLFGPIYNHVYWYMQHKDHLTMHTINIFFWFLFLIACDVEIFFYMAIKNTLFANT